MTTITRTALLPYSAAELFALVDDVARYSEFLPFCIASEVIERGESEVLGRIAFARLGLSHALTSRNRLQAPHRIDLELVDGPFERLAGCWQFQVLAEQACKVSFSIEFQVEARYLQFAAATAINQAATSAVDAFHKRAIQLYGKR